jgi:hypothetical protein
VRITLRNADNSSLLVPSGVSPPGCATACFEFVFFDRADAAVGRSFRDDRKDCKQQPRVLLRPGETTTADVELGQLNEHGHTPRTPFRPAPDRYRLHVTVIGAYYSADSGRRDIWKDEALSNGVTFEIKQ